MVIDYYKERNQNGTRLIYKKGQVILHNGNIYVCVKKTEKSPTKESKSWFNTGFIEPYYGTTEPVKPIENQLWIKNSDSIFVWKKDFKKYSWIKI
jgi:hypothetical protein